MLCSDIISSTGPVRATLQDGAANRWSDNDLLAFVTDFVRLVQSRFPNVRRNDQGDLDPIQQANLTSGDTIPLPDDWIMPWLQEYVWYRAFASDAKDEANRAQAEAHATVLRIIMPDLK